MIAQHLADDNKKWKMELLEMSFTVHDFHEMTQLFYQNPEFRAELRRLVLTDEMLNLPEQMRTTSEEIHKLYEISKQQSERLGHIEDDIETLKTDVTTLKTDVATLKTDVATLKIDMADVKGDVLEINVRDRVFVYLSRFARRLRLVTVQQLADLAEDALDAGQLTESEFDQVKLLDVVARGRDRETGETIYLAGEVSYTVNDSDLERAIERAGLLQTITETRAFPVVVGKVIPDLMRQKITERGAGWALLT